MRVEGRASWMFRRHTFRARRDGATPNRCQYRPGVLTQRVYAPAVWTAAGTTSPSSCDRGMLRKIAHKFTESINTFRTRLKMTIATTVRDGMFFSNTVDNSTPSETSAATCFHERRDISAAISVSSQNVAGTAYASGTNGIRSAPSVNT